MSTSPATPLFNPQDFHLPPGVSHVCAGGETAFLRRHEAAMSEIKVNMFVST